MFLHEYNYTPFFKYVIVLSDTKSKNRYNVLFFVNEKIVKIIPNFSMISLTMSVGKNTLISSYLGIIFSNPF